MTPTFFVSKPLILLYSFNENILKSFLYGIVFASKVIGKFGANSKLSNTITIDSSSMSAADYGGNQHQQRIQLSNDLKQLALSCLPKQLRDTDPELQQLARSNPHHARLTDIVDTTHDLCLRLDLGGGDDGDGAECTFRVHKAFLAERCEYFRTFLHDPFNETTERREEMSGGKRLRNVSELSLKQIQPEVLAEIIFFLYSNDFSRRRLDESVLYEVLIVADFYLLPSLKRKCATELISYHLTSDNLFDMFKLSRVYDLKKLEFACISYLAENLDKVS